MHRNVHLLGELSEFGDEWSIEATSIGDIFKLIDCQTDGFRAYLVSAMEAGLDIAIVSNDPLTDPDELLLNNLGGEEVYMSLIPAGSKKGWGRILLGVVLIVAGAALGGAFGVGAGVEVGGFSAAASQVLIAVGISLALQGVTQLLSKTPDTDEQEKSLGIFDGPDSTLKQGQPVPILYGELLVGGAPFHVDLTLPKQRSVAYSIIPYSNTNTVPTSTTPATGDLYTAEATPDLDLDAIRAYIDSLNLGSLYI